MVEIGESAFRQRPHEIEGERGVLIAPEQQIGVGSAILGREAVAIDQVTTIGGQAQLPAALLIPAARLGVLTGDPSHAHQFLLGAVHENQTHLQEDLELRGDGIRGAGIETLRAIPPL